MALGEIGNIFFIAEVIKGEDWRDPPVIRMGCTTLPRLIEVHREGSYGGTSFTCLYACEVADGEKIEKHFHLAWGDRILIRPDPRDMVLGGTADIDGAEFRVEPMRVQAIAELFAIKEIKIDEK